MSVQALGGYAKGTDAICRLILIPFRDLLVCDRIILGLLKFHKGMRRSHAEANARRRDHHSEKDHVVGLLQRLSADSLNGLESAPAANAFNYAAEVLRSTSRPFPRKTGPTSTPASASSSRNSTYAVGASRSVVILGRSSQNCYSEVRY